MQKIYLIIGLGNPGKGYENNRHNIGFMAVDEIATKYNCEIYREKFSSLVSQLIYKDKTIFLLKPQSFMNNSGVPVRKFFDYYKISLGNVIVIHDDIDLGLGIIKKKIGGGSAGHNGLKSIDSFLSNNYYRIRLGIGRPECKEMVSSYVLDNFLGTEIECVRDMLNVVSDDIFNLVDRL